VHVKFFGSDGSQAGDVATLQLKPGESRSVTAPQLQHLLRASISTESDADAPKACDLKTRVEVFDLQTGTTFVSVAADSSGGRAECAPPSSPPTALNVGQDQTASVGRRRGSRRYRYRR
jgi:hypothetical protein